MRDTRLAGNRAESRECRSRQAISTWATCKPEILTTNMLSKPLLIHLPRQMGGRGIPDIRLRHHKQLNNLRKYFYKKAESSELHLVITQNDRKATPLKLTDRNFNPINEVNSPEQQIQQGRSKPLHGKYLARIEDNTIYKAASTAFLRHGNIFAETEGFIVALQDQVIPTKVYRRKIIGENIENLKCCMCNVAEESLDHVMSECTVLAPKAYLDRHDRVGKIIHQKIRERYMT